MKGAIWLILLQIVIIILPEYSKACSYSNFPGDTVCFRLKTRIPAAPDLKPVTWEDIQFSQETPLVENKFVIVTNRQLTKEKQGLIFSNYRKEKIYYLVVFKKEDKWIVSRKNNFEDAFYEVDNMSPSLFYVHGYGKTFPGVISDGDGLNRFYKVSLIIFDWPSRNPKLFELKSYNLAKEAARESVEAFCKTIKDYQEYKKKHWKGHSVKSTLMLHSLGNLIIQKSLESNRLSEIEEATFDSVILNAPAVASRGHEKWVKKIDFCSNIYITSNHKDLSFFGLWWLTFKKYLGAKKEKGKARNVLYVNLSEAAKVNHNYFLNPDLMIENKRLKLFYFSILTNKVSFNHKNCLIEKNSSYFLY